MCPAYITYLGDCAIICIVQKFQIRLNGIWRKGENMLKVNIGRSIPYRMPLAYLSPKYWIIGIIRSNHRQHPILRADETQ